MHSCGVVHRDLTSYNILLDFGRPWQVKVSPRWRTPVAGGRARPAGQKGGRGHDHAGR